MQTSTAETPQNSAVDEARVAPVTPDAKSAAAPAEIQIRRGTASWRRKLTWLWKVAGQIVAVGVAIFAIYVIGIAVTDNATTIEPLSTPKVLADNGYTPEVAAVHLRAALERALRAAQSGGPELSLKGEKPDFVVPTVGVSAYTIANSIRRFLPIAQPVVISGNFTIAENQLWLRLRAGGDHIYANAQGVSPERVRQLFDAAAPAILHYIWPTYSILISYRRSPERALELADRIIQTASSANADVRNAHRIKGAIYTHQQKYEEGLKSFTAASQGEKRPEMQAFDRLGHAAVYHRQGRQDKVAEELARVEALLEGKDAPDALILLYIAQGRLDEIDAAIRKYVKKNVLKPGIYNEVGIIFSKVQKSDQAIASYREALLVDPDDIATNMNLGLEYLIIDQRADAAAFYRKAIAIDPHDARVHDARMALGNMLRDEGRLEEAIAEFRKAAEMPLPASFLRFGSDPHEPIATDLDRRTRARIALATALRVANKHDEAAAEFAAILELEPRNVGVHFELAITLREQDKIDQAINAIRKVIALEPENSSAHLNLGAYLRDANRLDEAIMAFGEAKKFATNNVEVYDELAKLLINQKRPSEAEAEYREAIKISPGDPRARRELGILLLDQKRHGEAIDQLRIAIGQEPSEPVTYFNLGVVLRSDGRLDEAMSALGDSIWFGSELPYAFRELAEIFEEQGKLDEAIHHLRLLVERVPDDDPAHLQHAMLLRKAKDWDGAVAAFRGLLQRAPDNPASHYNLAITLIDRFEEERRVRNPRELAEACQLLIKGREIDRSHAGFLVEIKRADRLMAKTDHCPKALPRAKRQTRR